MKILAVETATAWQSVALLDGPHVVARSGQDAAGSHAKRLVPAIDRLFREAGWTLDSLDGLAVSIGPGSFTGLRVGIATMLGFRSVTGLPLAAVPTLEGMAWNLRGADRPLCPILKSRASEVYWARYRWAGSGVLECVAEERVGSLGELARSIEGPLFVFGEGWQAYREELGCLLGPEASDVCEPPLDVMAASAVSIGLAGMDLLAQGLIAEPGLSPRYVQRAEAEVLWERRASGSIEASPGR